MIRLKDVDIQGNRADVEAVKDSWGEVEFALCDGVCMLGIEPVRMRITRVLANYYRTPFATPETAPLFILVPYKTVRSIWPRDQGDDVRYGTARKDSEVVTGALVVHKGFKGLYFCLSPEGERIDDVGSLGI